MDPTAKAALDGLASLPGGPALLAASHRIPGLWLVGGAVRDAALGVPARDLDVAVEGEIEPVAEALGELVEAHGRFGTAEVHTPDGGRINVARTRAESYAEPGALPDVRPAGIDEDLARRDFTVNAVAVSLPGGELRAVPGALDDLDARVLRVLHDGSFTDDPTRLVRMARYASRLGLRVERHTGELARRATLNTVSGDRLGNEVRLLLAEPDPVTALAAGAEWGGPLIPRPEPELARDALELLPEDGRADLLVLASGSTGEMAQRLRSDLQALGFTTIEVVRAHVAAHAPALAIVLGRARRPSEIAAAAQTQPPEAVALAGALGPADAARAWLDDLRHVTLEINGHDLLAAGVTEGPEVGRRLAQALDRRLDGEIPPGREAELDAALA